MKSKFTILLFGLLLAVGWTNGAQAQLLPEYQGQEMTDDTGYEKSPYTQHGGERATGAASFNNRLHGLAPMTVSGQSTTSMNAPRRAESVTASAVHDRAWYANYRYTWYDASNGSHTSYLTDIATDPYQMLYLAASTYVTPAIPGILHSDGHGSDVPYPGIPYGYGITGTNYVDQMIRLSSSNALIRTIAVYNASNDVLLGEWTGGSLPTGWTSSTTLQSTTVPGSGSDYTWYYMNGGGTISIPHSLIDGLDSIYIQARYRALEDLEEPTRLYLGTRYFTLTTTAKYGKFSNVIGGIDRPTENGYTVFLVKLKDDADYSYVRETTTDRADLASFYDEYVESMELLTDGMRVGESSEKAGTVFAYTGILDKFFFISKGKMYWLSGDRAPYYSMYEEFSPYVASQTANQKDLYANMTAGEYYPIVHDCQSVIYMKHFFSMAGKDTIAPKAVSSLVFYIPDHRGAEELNRTYREDMQPQVGLYTIHLAAETAPIAGYSEENRKYDVFLDWTSSLNLMVNNEVPQTYIIYKVTFDDHGNRVYTYLDEVEDVTTYSYQEDQLQTSQTFTYVILGYPTGATNKPVLNADGTVESGQFYAYSNLDDVQIPGWFDFMVLYRERYESDFVIPEEKNYYRNYLYPTNLTPGTGMTMGQLKQEWPNQTASYTLWRDNTGVAKLEVRAIGNKVYYRIRYYEGSQVTTSPNNIEMPYPYVEIPNDNN